ncbi:MAG TPA: hypothetical protein VFM96_15205 [Gaiellaceae bacterium]|nr:hypothetical protein [Gaiellaceae bacterium]
MFAAPPASIALSSYSAAAKPVAIVLKLQYEMQCGWPGPTIAVTFPTAERMARVPRQAVLVNGQEPATAALSRRTVSLTIARPKGVMCDVIGPGTATVEFTRAAGIGNPRTRGVYPVTVQRGKLVLRTSFRIR